MTHSWHLRCTCIADSCLMFKIQNTVRQRMVFRRVQIPLWLVPAALLATFVIGSTAGPVMLPAVAHSFRIVTADVTDVIPQDVTPEIAQTLHMSHPEGVVVTDLTYTPLRRWDVILSVNGKP